MNINQAKARAKELADKGNTTYQKIADTLADEGYKVSESNIRKVWKIKIKQIKAKSLDETQIQETLLKKLKKVITLTKLAEITSLSKRVLKAHIEDLKELGYIIDSEGDNYWMQTKPVQSFAEHKQNYNGETEIVFGLVSDTHLGNKYQQLTHLNNFYDICEDRGINKIFHCGDISDGYYKTRPSHVYELHKIGFDEQADYIIDVYPYRKGITTDFITGNHDNTHIMNGGSNIGTRIASSREDLNYLGLDYAKIWLTPKCDMDLIHPGDGTSYALSYKPQKRIDSLQGGSKPKMMVTGHYHKTFYMLYRNIHSILISSFEAQTPFLRSKALYADVGGMIITVNVTPNGEIKDIIPEFIPYYEMIENDY